MSGLIWAGLGKGIADASSTFGTMMMRQNEEDRRDAREEAREARKLQAAETREEQAKQRMIQEIAAAREGGAQIGRERVAGQVLARSGSQMAGDSPVMDPAEFANILRDNPEYEQLYRQAGLVTDAMDPRAQRATDEYSAALSAGASSATLQGLEKAKKSMLDLIREENQEKRRTAEMDLRERAEDRRTREGRERISISQQQADTASSRVTGGPSQSEVSSAESALNNATRRVADAWDARNPETMQDKVDPTAQAARAARRDREVNQSPEVLRARQRLENLYGNQRPGPVKPGDNTGTSRAPLESFMRQ